MEACCVATSVSSPAVEEMLGRRDLEAFWRSTVLTVLRRRMSPGSPALERRLIAFPKGSGQSIVAGHAGWLEVVR
jgi:hypothetical protein